MPTGDQRAPAARPGQPSVRVGGPLAEPEATAVLDLVRQAAEDDGVSPLSEHVLLHLRYGGDAQARNVLLRVGDVLAGYGHLDSADQVAGPSGEMVVHPAYRCHGLGLALGRALASAAGDRGLRLWAHGDLPAAARLAAAAGFERTRALYRLRRSLRSPLDAPRLPDGITVRTFVAGQDEDAWLELNRRAFARHPEQGAWTRADLDLREREPWFDPAGFFLAERDGHLAGFHWTKVHRGTPPAPRGHEAIGEVYVVGVDPSERGTGLGRALTLVGLQHLKDHAIQQVMLYVDEDNKPAIGLYESLGFSHLGTDVMFSGPPATNSA